MRCWNILYYEYILNICEGFDVDDIKRLKKLLALAEEDSVYQLWSACYAENKKAFEAFANSQPEVTRNYLWGYAESGRLIYQRLINLACTHMVFPEEGNDSEYTTPPADIT